MLISAFGQVSGKRRTFADDARNLIFGFLLSELVAGSLTVNRDFMNFIYYYWALLVKSELCFHRLNIIPTKYFRNLGSREIRTGYKPVVLCIGILFETHITFSPLFCIIFKNLCYLFLISLIISKLHMFLSL